MYYKPQYSPNGIQWKDYSRGEWSVILEDVRRYAKYHKDNCSKNIQVRIISVVETIEVVEVL